MKQLQQWVMQVRYPYAAGIIAVMWIGTAIFAYLKPDVPLEFLVGSLAVSTIIIAITGRRKPAKFYSETSNFYTLY